MSTATKTPHVTTSTTPTRALVNLSALSTEHGEALIAHLKRAIRESDATITRTYPTSLTIGDMESPLARWHVSTDGIWSTVTVQRACSPGQRYSVALTGDELYALVCGLRDYVLLAQQRAPDTASTQPRPVDTPPAASESPAPPVADVAAAAPAPMDWDAWKREHCKTAPTWARWAAELAKTRQPVSVDVARAYGAYVYDRSTGGYDAPVTAPQQCETWEG